MIKVQSLLAVAALVITPTAVHAETSPPVSFRHGGELYTYTVEQIGKRRIIRGSAGSPRETFVLIVGATSVRGTVNHSPVSFSLRSVRPVAGIVVVDQLAKR